MNQQVLKIWLLLCISFAVFQNGSYAQTTPVENIETADQQISRVKFRKNKGQWADHILYKAVNSSTRVALLDDRIAFASFRAGENGSDDPKDQEVLVWNMVFTNHSGEIVEHDKSDSHRNYIFGRDHSRYVKNAPDYGMLTYKNISDGIDLKYYGKGTKLKYDIVVSPHANLKDLKIRMDGISALEVNRKSELEMTTPWGIITDQAPYSYQLVEGTRKEVNVVYSVFGDNEFGFEIVGDYDPNIELVIDPVIVEWSTYVGADTDGYLLDQTVDPQGNVYSTGWYRENFPTTPGVYKGQNAANEADVFLFKLSSDGSNLLWATYIGGALEPDFSGNNMVYRSDAGTGVAINSSGDIVVAGYTQSHSFPLLNAVDNAINDNSADGSDYFVLRLSGDGQNLLGSTYLGGDEPEISPWGEVDFIDENKPLDFNITPDVVVGPSDEIVLSGGSNSADYPTQNAYQPNLNSPGGWQIPSDAVVTKLSPAGDQIVWSTYLGGTSKDEATNLAIDKDGEVYITGVTFSDDFPGAVGTLSGIADIPVAKFDVNGQLVYSKLVGGNDDLEEMGMSIHVDDDKIAYVTGWTKSASFPAVNAYDGTKNSGDYRAGINWGTPMPDAIVFKLDQTGTNLLFSTYIGGKYLQAGEDLKTGKSGEVFVVGMTLSPDFPVTECAVQKQCKNCENYEVTGHTASRDLFFSIFSSDGSKLIYSQYWGGGPRPGTRDGGMEYHSNLDFVYSSCLEEVVVSITSHSRSFPTTAGAYQQTKLNEDEDQPAAFKIKPEIYIDFTLNSTPKCGEEITFTDATTSSCVWEDVPWEPDVWEWDFGDGTVMTGKGPHNHSYDAPGTYNVKLKVSCPTDSVIKQVIVEPDQSIEIDLGPDQELCDGGSFTLDAGTHTGANYQWNTGENTQTLEVNASGEYIVVVDAGGTCTYTDTVTINFNDPPVVALSFDPTCEGDTATLDAGNPGATYNWSNGETTQSIGVTDAGNYSVDVSFGNGCDATDDVDITFNPAPEISIEDTSLCGTSVTIHTDGTADSYTWSTGETTASITVTAEGTYSITVSDASGLCTSTDDFDVSFGGDLPVALSDAEICPSGTTVLDAGSSGESYLWSTGETTQTISVSAAGTYTVQVDSGGCSGSAEASISVTQPVAEFTNTKSCEGAIVTFTDQSQGPAGDEVISWEWDFGDGGSSTEQHPEHHYANAGTYDVDLIIVTQGGCRDTIQHPVEVFPKPAVTFATTGNGCAPVEVQFTDSSLVSTGDITSWFWDFGDGNISTEQHPTHTYNDPGEYDIKLIVSTADRCADSITVPQQVEIFPYPEADFSANPWKTIISFPEIDFIDESTGDITGWHWDFGDGDESNTQHPSHTFNAVGTYDVTLTVTNEVGCPSQVTKPVEIGPEFAFYVPNVFTPNGKGPNEGFIGQGVGVVEHQMWIYDRWGLMIYNTDNTKQGEVIPWNGKIQGSQVDCQEDTYVYVVKIKDVFDRRHKYVGHVSLVK